MMDLEEMIAKIDKDFEKVAVVGDIHVPFQDKDALEIAKAYLADYKPDKLVINGDLLDFYSLSTFDKNPERKVSVAQEISEAKGILRDLRDTVGKDCKIYMTEGNHEQRLQRYLWRNPELEDLPQLQLPQLLQLPLYDIDFVRADGDYWKTDTGHLKIGDMIVMHGDSRLNGGSASAKAGYSVMNTMLKTQSSVTMGHVHRQALVYHSTPYNTLIGMEHGSLCLPTGCANWQQGMSTFELSEGKVVNPQIHRIADKKMYVGPDVYYV